MAKFTEPWKPLDFGKGGTCNCPHCHEYNECDKKAEYCRWWGRME